MTTTFKKILGALAFIAALLSAAPAHAALLDHGPADPVLVFPQWYRDLNGTAVGLCKSQVQSPNPAAGPGLMCFPLAADPTAFAGNIGGEVFYSNLTVLLGKGAAAGGTTNFAMRYVAALEAAYVPGPGPAHGQEVVFARIRVVANVIAPGTYTVTHPYGVEVFPDVQANGPRSIFFTVDVPLGVPGDFDGALNGRVGPFIQWDVVNPGETLTVGTQQFLGDPNYNHSYTGSPFNTNFVRVDGPPGSNLDGAGNDFMVTPLGGVLGQKWTAPIATAFNVQKAVYRRDATNNTIDIWATSAAGQTLVATGTDLPSLKLAEFPGGNYYGHIVYPAATIPPASILVSNLSSNPISAKQIQLVDQLDATATYDSSTGSLVVNATSSDPSSTLTVLNPVVGLMTGAAGSYTFSTALPATVEPPIKIRVESNAGSIYLADVVPLAGTPMNAATGAPVAVNDAFLVGTGVTPLDVLVNDTFTGGSSILVLSQPTTGVVTAPLTGGPLSYSLTPGASGPDSFTYAIQDAAGVISNVATVALTVPFVAPPPTANADNFAMRSSTTFAYAVISNDVAATGTTLDPASILVTQGANGVAVPNANGTVSYTPTAGLSGTFTFGYTVANTAGTRSAPTTVTVVVFAGPESVSFSRAQYTVSKSAWSIAGSTNWTTPALTQLTATCWTGTALAPTATTLIGKAPVDATGKFALVPVGPTPTPLGPSAVTCQTSSGGRASTGVVFK